MKKYLTPIILILAFVLSACQLVTPLTAEDKTQLENQFSPSTFMEKCPNYPSWPRTPQYFHYEYIGNYDQSFRVTVNINPQIEVGDNYIVFFSPKNRLTDYISNPTTVLKLGDELTSNREKQNVITKAKDSLKGITGLKVSFWVTPKQENGHVTFSAGEYVCMQTHTR